MAPRPRGPRRPAPGVAARYEGPEALTAMLAAAGSPHSAEEVAARFAAAQAAGEEKGLAIPALFPAEPRFGSPDEARRLFENLLGLWSRVAAGRGAGGTGAAGKAPPPPPDLPPRGEQPGDRLGPDLVEAVWKHLAALPERERSRVRHRFESSQPELVAWLAAAPLPESGAAAALDLCFEAWAMLDRAFGDRLGPAAWTALRELAAEPPPLEIEEPALAAYAAEQLETLEGEDPAFGPAERAQVERTVAAAVAALRRTIGEEPPRNPPRSS